MPLAATYSPESNHTPSQKHTPQTSSNHQPNTVLRVDFTDLIHRIREHSSIFQDIPDSIVRQILRNVHEYPRWTILIEEWQRRYPCFYILLRGEVEVSMNEHKITDLSGFQILGEYGFMGEPRTATVMVKKSAYAIQVLKSNVEQFSPEIQTAFYKNLMRESKQKMIEANRSSATVAPKRTTSFAKEVRRQVEQVF